MIQVACGANDQTLTSANNNTAVAYLAKNSITTGAGFAVGATEDVQFIAGYLIRLDNDTTIGGQWSAAVQSGVCP